MALTGMRFRERNSAIPDGNRVLAGGVYVVDDHNPSTHGLWANVWSQSYNFPQLIERCWDEIHPGPPFLSGGPFASIKVRLPGFDVQAISSYPTGLPWGATQTLRYEGGLFDPYIPPSLNELDLSDYVTLGVSETDNPDMLPDLTALGSLAYARLRPKLSQAGGYVFLREARDIPRMLQTSAKGFHDVWRSIGGNASGSLMRPKAVSDHFLNHQFGWVPFLSDLSTFYKTFQNAAALKGRLASYNGRWKRKKRADETVKAEETLFHSTSIYGCQPAGYPFTGYCFQPPYEYKITKELVTNVWYEGEFKYYRPEFDRTLPDYDSAYKRLMREVTLYGFNINPTNIYRSTPWTWLIDWFTDLDDKVQVLEDMATDQVVSKYMYLMHHLHRRIKFSSDLHTRAGAPIHAEWFRVADIKRRAGTLSPFEFNLSWDSMSIRQLGILAALGISRTNPRTNPA